MPSTSLQNELPAPAATAAESDPFNTGGKRNAFGREGIGVRKRILKYFAANPDEELGRQDMAIKFSVSAKTIDQALAQLKKSGELVSVHAWRLPSKGTL